MLVRPRVQLIYGLEAPSTNRPLCRTPQSHYTPVSCVAGRAKRGGARVIYFLAADGVVWLLIVYKKAKFDNLATSFLAQLKEGVEDGL